MKLEDFEYELVHEWSRRELELSCLFRLLDECDDEHEQNTLRRTIVVFLYAHVEGHVKFALLHYVRFINNSKIQCKEAVSSIVAGAWDNEFRSLEQSNEKYEMLNGKLPEDTRLHRHWRRRKFIEKLLQFLENEVQYPDDLIDTESNLKPHVIRRNLFVLGLSESLFEEFEGDFDMLLGVRNGIAHGDTDKVLNDKLFGRYRSTVSKMCTKLQVALVKCASDRAFVMSAFND